MAYSNWGGFVYCDDHALHDHCDATPRQVFGLQSEYASYMQHFVETAGEDKPNPFTDMYHAVVGDEEAGVLVCLHKSYIGAVISGRRYRHRIQQRQRSRMHRGILYGRPGAAMAGHVGLLHGRGIRGLGLGPVVGAVTSRPREGREA